MMSLFKKNKNSYDSILRYETYINGEESFLSQQEIEEIGYYAILKNKLCNIIYELENKGYKVISQIDFDNDDFVVNATKVYTTKKIKITKRFKLMNKKVR